VQGAYLDFWRDQSLVDQMLGGFGVSTFNLSGEPFTLIGLAPHSTLLDVLFTCGLIGLVVFVWLALASGAEAFRKFQREGDEVALAFLVGKVTWLVFAMTLSVFPSWTYLLLLFVV
jgi:O-antigen ligase